MAVPSCAAVMIPDAVPHQESGTAVPSVVAATEDRPSPVPASVTLADRAQLCAAAAASAVSATAIAASPAAIAGSGLIRRSEGAARAEPATTPRLRGSIMAAACNGLRRRVS